MSILTKTINEYIKEAHDNAKKHGWWDEPKSMGELLMLIVTEVAEAMEEHRNGRGVNETYYSNTRKSKDEDGIVKQEIINYCGGGFVQNSKPEGIPSELADVVIRIFDMCGYYGINLEDAIIEKMEYNRTRPYKHGNKKL